MARLTSVAEVIRGEQDALARETRIAQCPPIVALNSMEGVARVPSSLRYYHKTSVSPLPKAKGAAFIVDCPSLSSTVLWVGTDNEHYRPDYLTFLNAAYELGIRAVPSPYDVDHLYNQSRARMYGLKFIRLALVSQRANRSHGAAYEKDLTTNEALRGRQDMKLMDEITSMKYFGFLSPLRTDPRESEIAAYATFAAAKLGLDANEVRESIRMLRQKASNPWARK